MIVIFFKKVVSKSAQSFIPGIKIPPGVFYMYKGQPLGSKAFEILISAIDYQSFVLSESTFCFLPCHLICTLTAILAKLKYMCS